MVISLIKDYSIKVINNEEILYIYLDYNSEFASLDNSKKNKTIKDEIKKYLKDNNIDFKGVTVAIVVGGIMMGTILLNRAEDSKRYKLVSNGVGNIVSIIDNVNITKDEVVDEEIESVIYDVNISEEKNETNQINEIKNNNVISNDNNIKSETVKNEEIVNNIVEINKEEEIEEVQEVKKTVQEDTKDENNNLTYIKVYRSNGEILDIELEEYLIGVVGAEMPASFNIEALKAQSVVARTYALKVLESGKNLTDNSSTQNYNSNNELKTIWGSNYNKYYQKIESAVYSTKGMYLSYNGEYIDAVYHSTSNGMTEDAYNVWGRSVPYLKSVDSIYDNLNKSYSKTIFMTYDEVSVKLNNIVSYETVFNIQKNNSGRVSEIEINGIIYSGVVFRNLLNLRSADFVIEKNDTGINITTEGYGHGVGMSQYGANGMANNGYSFKDILFHYYTGVKLS